MATQFRSSLPDVFEDAQADLFFKRFAQLELLYPQIFNVQASTAGHEDAFKISGLGTFATKPEGTPISYDVAAQGPRRRITHTTFALGYRVTMEAQMDAQYDVIDRLPQDLGDSARDHQEVLAWGIFINSFGTANTGLDGLALVTTAHTTLKHKTPGTTLSNQISPGVALSVTGLETAITRLRTTQSEEGRQTPISPRWLIIHPDNEHEAARLLESTQEPGTNENQINVVARSRTGIQQLSVPYLTDSEDWWMTAASGMHGLMYYNRMDLTFDSGKDSQTKDALFDAVYRASVAIRDWRGVIGSNP